MCHTVQYSLFTFHIITWTIAFHWWLLFRLEFDAYRSDLEELSLGPRDAVAMARIDDAQQEYQVQKDKYERLRSDVIIKLKFLEENKVTCSRNCLFGDEITQNISDLFVCSRLR